MGTQTMPVIDGDGHVMEDWDGILSFMPEPYRQDRLRGRRLFPPLDHLHSGRLNFSLPGAFRQVTPDQWLEFMNDTGIQRAILYTTGGLAIGKIINSEFSVDVARAYNDWLYHTYVNKDDRFQGVGLIPMQVPDQAVKELRRVVEELGFVGAMIPSMGLKGHLGDKEYWPIYAEADRLGCCLAIHGGAHEGLGMDYLSPYAPINALGHPFGQMIAFAGIVFNAILDKFPRIRIGFMEAGVLWLMTCLERFDRGWETHIPYDPNGAYLQLNSGEKVSDYIIRHIKEGRIFIGCEGTEPMLPDAIRVVGSEPFIFSSDFPHEVNTEYCRHELEEIKGTSTLSEGQKHGLLHINAENFYRLKETNQNWAVEAHA